MQSNPIYKTIVSLITVVIWSPWLIVFYLLVSRYTTIFLSDDDLKVIQGFIEWFGTAYGLFLALVLVTVWSQYDTLEREFDRELDAIVTLYQTVKYFKTSSDNEKKTHPQELDNIIKNIKSYINHVLENYKIEHHKDNTELKREGGGILDEIGNNISLLTQNSQPVSEPIIYLLFESLREASDIRGDRISHSKQHLPEIVHLVAIVSSIIWLLSFFGLVIEDQWVSVVLIGGTTFIIVMILHIISDLNKPFEGTWNINMEEWEILLNDIDKESS